MAKAFSPASIPTSPSTLTFTVTNPNSSALTGVNFTDALPDGLVIATPNGLTTPSCSANGSMTGQTIIAVAGSSAISLSGATLATTATATNVTCTFSVNVTGTIPGLYLNITSNISSTETGPNTTSTGYGASNLTVTAVPPVINKAFSAASILTNGTTTLTFSINNPNTGTTLDGVSFSDSLPTGLVVATPNGLSGSCPSGTITATAGSSTISLSGASLTTAAPFCSFSVDVRGTTTGLKYNEVTVTSSTAGAGNTATASVLVKDPIPAISLLKKVGTTATGPWMTALDVPAGTPVYYRFTVENTGDVPFAPVAVTDPTLTGLGVSLAACSWPSGIAAGAFETCTTAAVSLAVGSRLNTATATGNYSGSPYTDEATANVFVYESPTVAKSFNPASISAGGTSTMTITVTNPASNPGNLTGVSIGDTYTGTLVNNADGSILCSGSGNANLTGGTDGGTSVGFTAGTIVPGGTCTITQSVMTTSTNNNTTTAPTATGPVALTGTAASSTLTVGSATAVSLVKTAPATVAADGSLVYTLTLSNSGTQPTGTSLVVKDLLPTGVTYVSAAAGTNVTSVDCSTAVGQLRTCALTLTAPLAASGAGTAPSASFTLTTTAPSSAGAITNYAAANPGGTSTPPGDPGASCTPNATTTCANAPTTVYASADLIAQKNGPALIAATGPITYSVRVSNAGPSDVIGAVVADPEPVNLSDMQWTCGAALGGAVCPQAAGDGEIDQIIAVFPAGGSLTYTISGTGPASGSVNNQVTITPPQGVTDPNLANNTDSVTTLIGANPSTADLAVFKYGPSTVAANGAITYVILVTNAGYAAANGAVFRDPVPAGFTWTCGNAVGGGVCPNPAGTGAIEQTLATFPAGASLTYTVTGTGLASGSVSNTATITAPADVPDPDPTNNTSTAVTTVGTVTGQADLSLVKTGSLGVSGNSITYSLVVTNSGPDAAIDARVVDKLPAALTDVVWGCGNGTGGGSCNDAEDTGDIDTTVNLPVGATITFTITAKTPESGAFANTAIVIPPAGLVDPDPSNNPSGAVIRQIGEIADMAVSLGGLPSEAAPGALVSGTVTCANVGTAPAREVTCALTGGTLGVCRVDGATVTLPLETLAAGKAIVCDLTATAPASGNLQLIATTDAENDSDPANNQDEVAIPVDLPVPLLPPTLIKAFTPSVIDPGQASTLSITLGNANSSALLLSAALEDTLPTGVTVISPVVLTGTTCTIAGVSTTSGSVRYANGASIPPGGCDIKVQVTATVGGKYVNLLAVGDLQTNGGGNEEPAEAVLYVDPADLAITKTLTTAGPYAAGQVISFTIVGTNNGPDAATGVVITDVPSNLTIQSVSGACTALPCTLGNLAVGSTVSITVVARINAVGNFTNTATITGAQPDPVPANNSASANGQAVDPIPPVAIPTLTELGMILMSLFLLAMARRRMSQGR